MTDLEKLASEIRAAVGLPEQGGRTSAPSRKEIVVASLRLLTRLIEESDYEPSVEVARAIAAAGANQMGDERAFTAVVLHLVESDMDTVYAGLGIHP